MRVREKPGSFQRWCMDNNLTAAEVAKRIGVSKSAVYAYYSGLRNPNRRTMQAMEEKLGINAKEMF